MADINEQLEKAKARVKRLEQRKLMQDAKRAIVENKDLKKRLSLVNDLIAEIGKEKRVINVNQQGQQIHVISADWLQQKLKQIIRK